MNTIQGRKLFMGGNYSRAETICGNTVIVTMGCETFFQMLKGTYV